MNLSNLNIVVSTTFMGDLLKSSLTFWADQFNLPLNLTFTGINSVFPQLLSPDSEIRQNTGINILLIRFDDWCRVEDGFETDQNLSSSLEQKFQQNINEFVATLKEVTSLSSATFIIGICPSMLENLSIDMLSLENQLLTALQGLTNVYTIDSSEVTTLYPITNFYDAYTDQIGHIPYTQLYFDLLGTHLMRKVYALLVKPYKVIVLDADGTLWKGVLGEDGANGVAVTAPYKALQDFMLKQKDAGMLLCLCTKNNESDILSHFDSLPNMSLKLSDFVALQINWNRKSQNLKALANTLNLSLESFIFIDDNPAECMEVNLSTPEVLTFTLPESSENIPTFLNHIWAFDHLTITTEDQKRNEFYKQDLARKQEAATASSMATFIENLGLELDIHPLLQEDAQRSYELMLRVNQFNFTSKRLTKSEFNLLQNDPSSHIITLKASDRFGQYGLVGQMFYHTDDATLILDNMMLSCRALNKGIEYTMLKELGDIAVNAHLSDVKIHFIQGEKNLPAYQFITKIGQCYMTGEAPDLYFCFPTEFLQNLNYKTYINDIASITPSNEPDTHVQAASSDTFNIEHMALIKAIPIELYTPSQIHTQIMETTRQVSQERPPYIAPTNEFEEGIVSIWEEILETSPIGINDNLFVLGGESIKAIQILSRIREKFNVELPLTVLFEDELTVNSLAKATQDCILNSFDEDMLASELAAIEDLSDEELEALLNAEE